MKERAGTEVITDIDSKSEKQKLAEEKKRLKAEKKEQKKEAKRRAKEIALQEEQLGEEDRKPSSYLILT